jgi:hypothetical protein
MRCTVDGLTPNRSAMTRMPGRPGVASRIRFSSAGATDQDASPRSWPAQARRGRVPESWRTRTQQTRPSSETSPCRRASWCRAPVGAGSQSQLSPVAGLFGRYQPESRHVMLIVSFVGPDPNRAFARFTCVSMIPLAGSRLAGRARSKTSATGSSLRRGSARRTPSSPSN